MIDSLTSLLRRRELTAKELKRVLEQFGWKQRYSPKNQPHYFKEGVAEYIVVDERYGENTIQKLEKWKKYIKRIKEHSNEEN